MNFRAARTLSLAAVTAGLLLCAPAVFALVPGTPQQRLEAYSKAIPTGNLEAATYFLQDEEAQTLADQNGSSELTAEAEALKDLKTLLAMPWNDSTANKLNAALAIRIDVDKPLSKVGVGPEPEKLLTWLEKNEPSYPERKTAVVKKAIRQWEVVFGTMTTLQIDWAQASGLQSVDVTKESWEKMVLRERNATLSMLMSNSKAYTGYSDDAMAAQKKQAALSAAVANIKSGDSLTPAQKAQLAQLEEHDKLAHLSDATRLNDQAYLLGSFFDGSKVQGDLNLSQVQAARSSLPTEVLPSQQRALLGGMLTTAVPKELAGTQAGDQVLAFYAKEGPLKIAVQPCDGTYSRYDPATRTITLDSETIQQYMRMKGYTADSVMKNADQVADIAKYMSPEVVYEAGHQMEDTWAKQQGVYNPHVQENEVQAMSLEGSYTAEKTTRDAAFSKMLDDSRNYSSYAEKRVQIALEYKNRGARGFDTTVRQLYSSSLPSLDAASSQVLDAIRTEQARRASMSPSARTEIDSTGLSLNEAMDMSPEELADSVGEVSSAALAKIGGDLSDLGSYKSYYRASDMGSRGLMSGTETSSAGGNQAPPAI
jgi:hypothetical protein